MLGTLQLKVRFACAITINVMKWGEGGGAMDKIYARVVMEVRKVSFVGIKLPKDCLEM